MDCTRCKSIMLYHDNETANESGEKIKYYWRCPSCGNIIDHVIIGNRISPLPPEYARRVNAKRKSTRIE
ncbi:MAG: hypothetical protein AAB581_00580 [Patescibacteria group bacterium]